MVLSQLEKCRDAEIVKIHDEKLAIKLFEMGLLPGEIIRIEHVAPFGDPIAVAIHENKLCIRIQDAAKIEVIPRA